MTRSNAIGTQPDIAVVGGGLAGLAAAAIVARSGHTVRLHESRGVVGGQARSVDSDGFVFNQGPHAFYRGGPGERTLTALGVELSGGAPSPKGRVVVDGRGEVAPGGPISLMRTGALTLRDKIAVGKALALLPRVEAARYASLTVDDWIERLVSSEGAARLLRSLARLATYVHQPGALSAEIAIGQLQLALGPGVLYLDGGWQSLVDQLRAEPGIEFVTGEALTETPDARAVIVAVGGPKATSALIGTGFDTGPSSSASCIDLGLRRRPIHDFVLGVDDPFYFSNHSVGAELAPDGHWHAAMVQYLGIDEEPDADGLDGFATHAGVVADDVVAKRRLHRMVTVTAIATAEGGGLAGRPGAGDTGLDNVFMAGDWVGPIGHLADASLASATEAARLALAAVGGAS